jgi:hypothetical protein
MLPSICWVLIDLLARPWALTISEQTRAQPASFASSRKGKFVIPAKGAKIVLFFKVTDPIFIKYINCLLLVVISIFCFRQDLQDYFSFFLTSQMEVRKLNPPTAEIKLLQ